MATILIAEELDTERALLQSALEASGYAVIGAQDGAQALGLARACAPDLILGAASMAGMDGFELCRRWKADAQLRGVPFVLYTAALADPHHQLLASLLGAERFVTKPESPEALSLLVCEVLQAAKLAPPKDEQRREVGAYERALADERRSSAGLFRALAEESASAIYVAQDARFSYVNPRLIELFGYASGELSGGLELAAVIHPEDLPMVLSRLGEQLAGAHLAGATACRALKKDGSVFEIEVYGSRIELQGKGAVTGTVRDVSRRARAEESTRILALMLDEAPAAIVVHDPSGALLYVNRYGAALHGYSAEEFLQLAVIDLLPAALRLGLSERLRANLTLDANAFNTEHVRKDGSTFPLHVRTKKVTWRGLPAVLTVMSDLSESARAEQQSAERSRFETLLSELSTRFISAPIESLDAEIEDGQRRVCECLALDVASLWLPSKEHPSSLTVTHIYRRAQQAALPLDTHAELHFPWTMREVLAGRAVPSSRPDDLPAEAETDRATRRRLGIVASLVLPVTAPGGAALGAMSFSTTHEERTWPEATVNRLRLVAQLFTSAVLRKRAEEALRASESRFRALSEASLVGVYSIQDGRLAYVNNAMAAFFGYTADELIGAEPNVLIDPADQGLVRENVRRRLAGEVDSLHYEFRGRCKNGEPLLVEVMGTRAELDGRPAVVGNIVNLTERRRLEEQFRQSQKMEGIGRLAGGIAHDFNNLLTVISSFAGFIKSATHEGDPIHEDVVEIEQAADRATSLTRQILAYSRRSLIKPQRVDLNVAIDHIQKMLRRILGEDVEVRLQPTAGPACVMIDPGQLDQILVNLAVNARDAMPSGGVCTLQTETLTLEAGDAAWELKAGPYVALTVRDTGVGMSREVREHLFEPFFTTKQKGEGTGLGLSTVFGIVKQAGGHIWVSSELGQGASFKLCFPQVTAAQVSAPPLPEPAPTSLADATVLIVDDEEGLRKVVRRTLERAGYHVLDAACGADALGLCRRHPGCIDLLLTDMVMPGMNGEELQLSFRRTRPEAAVLYMSGFPGGTISGRGLAASGIEVLQKPFKPQALLAKVEEAVRRSSMQHGAAPNLTKP
ncbi:MAG TPA: PAS domain S-box protein [Polyangiales bacterium]